VATGSGTEVQRVHILKVLVLPLSVIRFGLARFVGIVVSVLLCGFGVCWSSESLLGLGLVRILRLDGLMVGRGQGWPCLRGEELRALYRGVDRLRQI
jgi:hypothetical protein